MRTLRAIQDEYERETGERPSQWEAKLIREQQFNARTEAGTAGIAARVAPHPFVDVMSNVEMWIPACGDCHDPLDAPQHDYTSAVTA